MSSLINQGECIDEYGLRYEVLVNDETGTTYHAYRWDDLEVRRGCLARLGVSGQPPRYPLLEKHPDREAATAR